MDDLEDIEDAFDEIEDIVEEVADPEDLIEDFTDSPLLVLSALVAGLMAVFTFLMVVLAAAVVVLAAGPVWLFVLFAVFGVVATVLAVGAFLYVRTGLPEELRRRIDTAREHADERPNDDGSMTEEEAITALKNQYARGNLDDHELEQALDDAISSEDPEAVVERYRESH